MSLHVQPLESCYPYVLVYMFFMSPNLRFRPCLCVVPTLFSEDSKWRTFTSYIVGHRELLKTEHLAWYAAYGMLRDIIAA